MNVNQLLHDLKAEADELGSVTAERVAYVVEQLEPFGDVVQHLTIAANLLARSVGFDQHRCVVLSDPGMGQVAQLLESPAIGLSFPRVFSYHKERQRALETAVYVLSGRWPKSSAELHNVAPDRQRGVVSYFYLNRGGDLCLYDANNHPNPYQGFFFSEEEFNAAALTLKDRFGHSHPITDQEGPDHEPSN